MLKGRPWVSIQPRWHGEPQLTHGEPIKRAPATRASAEGREDGEKEPRGSRGRKPRGGKGMSVSTKQ